MLNPEIDRAFRNLVGAVAGPDALPAGGAAGVAAIAMGVGLGAKVIRFSPAAPTDIAEVATRLDGLLERLLPEFAADCAAFDGLLVALRRPRDDPARAAAVGAAWVSATVAPVRVAVLAADAEALLARCAGRVNPNLAGDLAAALELVRAGRRIAVANAGENAQNLDADEAGRMLGPLRQGD